MVSAPPPRPGRPVAERRQNLLNALKNACKRVAAGNYAVELQSPEGAAERELADAFNQMQKHLAAREEQIVYQSQHDQLTGLPNRAVMHDRVGTALARAHRQRKNAMLILVNIRRLKEINDTMGHGTGDEVLRTTAERLRGGLRATDSVLRLGGDDFLVVLEAGEMDALRLVASNLMARLSQQMHINELRINVHYMGGAAAYPEHGEDAESLLRRAEIALNLARERHETLHTYSIGEDEQHLRRVRIIADLPDAINQACMFLVYQPKVSFSDPAKVHAEALVRWIHPQLDFIPPDEFVMLAEQSGNVKSLTHYVIRTAVCQLRDWAARGIHTSVSVNLSALDLLDSSMPDVVQAYLKTYRVDPSRLTFEITESALMQDPELAVRVLHLLRGFGIRLAIDDFGTGYSSLSQLKRLPVDELKIDKSFVLELAPDTDDAAIVRSTIELGHNLGLEVVAEGIETRQGWDLLTTFGCDYAQGYLLSKPLAAQDFEEWLLARSQDSPPGP